MTIRDQIRYLLAAKLTQADIAKEIGVSQPMISMIITGKAKDDLKYSVALKLDGLVRKQRRLEKKGTAQ